MRSLLTRKAGKVLSQILLLLSTGAADHLMGTISRLTAAVGTPNIEGNCLRFWKPISSTILKTSHYVTKSFKMSFWFHRDETSKKCYSKAVEVITEHLRECNPQYFTPVFNIPSGWWERIGFDQPLPEVKTMLWVLHMMDRHSREVEGTKLSPFSPAVLIAPHIPAAFLPPTDFTRIGHLWDTVVAPQNWSYAITYGVPSVGVNDFIHAMAPAHPSAPLRPSAPPAASAAAQPSAPSVPSGRPPSVPHLEDPAHTVSTLLDNIDVDDPVVPPSSKRQRKEEDV